MQRHRTTWLCVALGLGLAGGCGDDAGAQDAGTTGRDVPCAVANLVDTYCVECHCALDTTCLSFGPLLTAADLATESPSHPGRTRASLSVEWMRSTTSPMPPGMPGTVPAAEIDAFAAWVDAGMPAASCPTAPPAP